MVKLALVIVLGVDEGRFVVLDDFAEPLHEDLVRAFKRRD